MDGRLLASVIKHRFQEAAQSSLVLRGYLTVLLDYQVFFRGERFLRNCLADPSEYERHIEPHPPSSAQVSGRGITRPSLIIGLGTFDDATTGGSLVLGQSTTLPFVAQPSPDLFRIVQNLSSKVFTNARRCIILHSHSHENAWKCTMPNTPISEQARQRARNELERRGQTVKSFALQNGLNPSTVYAVLRGQSQCRRGEAHRAAVLLGIKNGVIEE
ncbi:DNA-binding protein [Pseudomonas sp. NBRC 111125]|uniref:DNA-binding protein n=1 Tax=Pseudomonas sp. NBRC 111125 TaxID=1661040 RepID=UPI0040356E93